MLFSKLEIARNIVFAMNSINYPNDSHKVKINDFDNRLKTVEIKFILLTSHLFINDKKSSNKEVNYVEFCRIMSAELFDKVIDQVVADIEAYLNSIHIQIRYSSMREKKKKPSQRSKYIKNKAVDENVCDSDTRNKLQKCFDSYPLDGSYINYTNFSNKKTTENICQYCGENIHIDLSKFEMVCYECGLVYESDNFMTEDQQFYSQDQQRPKSGAFNPNRHFQQWWIRILAKESEEELGNKDDPDNMCGEKLLSSLRSIIRRDKKILKLLTVVDVRTMLRELNMTEYNKNISLILKKLTGIGPPQIPDSIAFRAENLFTRAIEIGEKVKKPDRFNRNYYPFYIFKILEFLIPESNHELRRIFYYIYIQGKDTVESDDLEWEKICKELGEIKYQPTNRMLWMRYYPTNII
jgi:hypothetical protein